MLPQGLVFSNRSEDYLASSSVVRPLSVLPSDTSHKALSRNHQKLLIIKRDAGSSFPIPLDTPPLKDIRIFSVFFSNESYFGTSLQRGGFLLNFSSSRKRHAKFFSFVPRPKTLPALIISCWLFNCLLPFIWEAWVFFSNTGYTLQLPRFWYSHKFCNSDLPYLWSS